MIDLVQIERAKREVRHTLTTMGDKTEIVLPSDYQQTLIECAHKLFKVGGVDEAMHILTMCTKHFIEDALPNLMSEDDQFAIVATELADMIVEAGIVDVEYRHDPAYEIEPVGEA